MSNREYTSLHLSVPHLAPGAVGPIVDAFQRLRREFGEDDVDYRLSFTLSGDPSPSLTVTASCGDDTQWDEDVHNMIKGFEHFFREGGIIEHKPGDRMEDVTFLGPTQEVRQKAKRRHLLAVRRQAQDGIALIDKTGGGALHRCDDCRQIHPASALKEPKDLEQRMDFKPGDPRRIEPSGECPKCGALCYPVPAHEDTKYVLESVADQEGWSESATIAVLLEFLDRKAGLPEEFRAFLAKQMLSSGNDETPAP